jgi:hypothetical protein
MPQELLKLIQALETYRAKQAAVKKMPDKFTVSEFVELMDQMFSDVESDDKDEVSEPLTQSFIQHQGSYKVLSLDGTLTALDLASTDLVQVTKNSISIVWPHTSIDFTLAPNKGSASISKEEFHKLAEFVTQ